MILFYMTYYIPEVRRDEVGDSDAPPSPTMTVAKVVAIFAPAS